MSHKQELENKSLEIETRLALHGLSPIQYYDYKRKEVQLVKTIGKIQHGEIRELWNSEFQQMLPCWSPYSPANNPPYIRIAGYKIARQYKEWLDSL